MKRGGEGGREEGREGVEGGGEGGREGGKWKRVISFPDPTEWSGDIKLIP